MGVYTIILSLCKANVIKPDMYYNAETVNYKFNILDTRVIGNRLCRMWKGYYIL